MSDWRDDCPYCKCGCEMVPQMDENEWVCPSCGMEAWGFYKLLTYEDGTTDYDDIYDEKPLGCTSCDNPDYPMCKDSCPMFD